MKKARSISVKGSCSFPSTLQQERVSSTKPYPLWWSRGGRIIRPAPPYIPTPSWAPYWVRTAPSTTSPRNQRLPSLWRTSLWTALPYSVFPTTSIGISPPRPFQTQMTESLKSSWKKWKQLCCSYRKRNPFNSAIFWPMMFSHTSKMLCRERQTPLGVIKTLCCLATR